MQHLKNALIVNLRKPGTETDLFVTFPNAQDNQREILVFRRFSGVSKMLQSNQSIGGFAERVIMCFTEANSIDCFIKKKKTFLICLSIFKNPIFYDLQVRFLRIYSLCVLMWPLAHTQPSYECLSRNYIVYNTSMSAYSTSFQVQSSLGFFFSWPKQSTFYIRVGTIQVDPTA